MIFLIVNNSIISFLPEHSNLKSNGLRVQIRSNYGIVVEYKRRKEQVYGE